MTKHTPGPWSTQHKGAITSEKKGEGLSGFDDTGYYGGYLIAESVHESNARLIAAAPDLLEAAEALAAQYRRKDNTTFDLKRSWKALEAAIKAAKGEA